MDTLTLLFLLVMMLAALFVTLTVRREFLAREEAERERRYRAQRTRTARRR